MLLSGEGHAGDVQEKGQRCRRGQGGRSRSHNCPRPRRAGQCHRRSRCRCRRCRPRRCRRYRRYQVLHAHRCEEARPFDLPRQPPCVHWQLTSNVKRSWPPRPPYIIQRARRACGVPLAIRRVKSEDLRFHGARARDTIARRRYRRSRGDFNARLSTPSIGKTERERARRRERKRDEKGMKKGMESGARNFPLSLANGARCVTMRANRVAPAD